MVQINSSIVGGLLGEEKFQCLETKCLGLFWSSQGQPRTAEEIDPQNGTDIPFQTYVQRGELMLEIPAENRIARKDGTPSHNYRLYGDPAITLYDDGTGVCPLQGAEFDYLKAVQKPTTRILQYFDTEKMKWIMDLKLNDIVFFKFQIANKAPSLTVKGKVRHYGLLEGHCGVMFGLEIIVRINCYS